MNRQERLAKLSAKADKAYEELLEKSIRKVLDESQSRSTGLYDYSDSPKK